MARSVARLISQLVPPLLLKAHHRLCNKKKWGVGQADQCLNLSGAYQSWTHALADSTGYDSDIILKKTKEALLKVKRGEAVYERDAVLFNEIYYSWPLLAALLWVAAQRWGVLNVLDYGGALGSSYFQNRQFLAGLREVRWNIVEQGRHVEIGRRLFQDTQLKFYSSIEECLSETEPSVIILSGVLQYLEAPYKTLRELHKCGCRYLIIDRTPFWEGLEDRLCVQHISQEIYVASYPCWIFSKQRFQSIICERWNIIAEFDGFDQVSGPVETLFRGIIAAQSAE